MQTLKHSHYETLMNQVVGVIIGWTIVYSVFPLFDHMSQARVASISSVLFFTSSYIRGYLIRRFFNKRFNHG